MSDDDDKRPYWKNPNWQAVSYGDKKMLDWRREQKRLTELGLENEFYDILDVHDLSLTKGNKIKIDIDKTDN